MLKLTPQNDSQYKLEKALSDAICHEMPINFSDADSIDLSLISNEKCKRIIGTFKELYQTPTSQPNNKQIADEVHSTLRNLSYSEEDANKEADAIEELTGRRVAPDVSLVVSALASLRTDTTKPREIKATFVNYPDVRDDNKPLNTYDNLKALVDALGLNQTINRMNLELEMFRDGKLLNISYDAKRSLLISEANKTGLPKSAIDDHIGALAENKTYHPVNDWLNGATWDGVKRVDKLIDALNAKDKKAARIAMGKWFVACIAALYEPNFTCKLVPILQGDQSYMKTAFISRLANVVDGSFLEGAELNPDNKDSILSCIRAWIVELGELERTSKNSQGSLKAFITKNIDSVRPPYGRTDIKKKRQTVFIASVNGTEFLRDETGSSRYAVIELSKAIDMNVVNNLLGWEYKDGRVNLVDESKLKQFWLEVKHQYDNGASWMLDNAELALFANVNNEHKFKGQWRHFLEEKFLDVDMDVRSMEWMKSSEVCAYCEIQPSRSREVGKALAAMTKDGLIKSRKLGAGVTKYHLPTISER